MLLLYLRTTTRELVERSTDMYEISESNYESNYRLIFMELLDAYI